MIERLERSLVLGLLAVVPVAFWRPIPDAFGLPKASLVIVVATVLGGLVLARVVWERELRIPVTPLTWALGAFLAVAGLATVTSPYPMLSVVGEYSRYTGLASYAAYALVATVILTTCTLSDVRRLVWSVVGALAVVSAYGLVQVLHLDPYEWPQSREILFSTLGNANFLAGFLAVGAPLAAYGVVTDRPIDRRLRVGFGLLTLLAAALAYQTHSFQGPMAVAAGLGFVVVALAVVRRDAWLQPLERRGVSRRVATTVSAGAVLAGSAVVVAAGILGLGQGLIERSAFWRAALRMFGSRPVLGVGMDLYSQFFLRDRPAGHAIDFGFSRAEAAHDLPLNMLAGGGLLLAAAYLAVVVVVAVALVQGLRRTDGDRRALLIALGGAWVAYQVQSLVSIDVPALALLHFVLAASIIVVAVDPPLYVARLRGRPGIATPTTWMVGAAIGAVVVAGLVVGTRPFRAEVAAAAASRAKSPEAADADLRRAIELAPWQGRYRNYRTQLHERFGDHAVALESAREALRREPGSSQFALVLAHLEGAYGQPAAAIRAYRHAVRIDPHNPEVLLEAAVAETKPAGDLDRALRLAEHAAASRPGDPRFDVVVADVHLARGDVDGAVRLYDAILARNPGYPQAVTGMARVKAQASSP